MDVLNAVQRTIPEALWDRTWGKFYGLPGEQNNFTVASVAIPVSGGVFLSGDLYQPILPPNTQPVGTVYHLTPYPRNIVNTSLGLIRPLAARGYQILDVSIRGTYGSGGVCDPGRDSIRDTQDVVRWMRKQEWYTGSFATMGISFNSFNEWALLEDPPADLVTVVMTAGPHDMSRHIWGTGAMNMDVIQWSAVVCNQGRGQTAHRWMGFLNIGMRLHRVWKNLPLVTASDDLFTSRAPWVHEWLMHPDLQNEYWKPMQCKNALERVRVPVLINSGWRDSFVDQAIEQYTRLRERGVNVRLVVGPWEHADVSCPTQKGAFSWLEEHLAGRSINRAAKSPVRICLSGSGQVGEGAWRQMREWPPPTTPWKFHLQRGGSLTPASPPHNATPSYFTFDPAKPTPSRPGPLKDGALSDEVLAARVDVLTFTSEPLERDVEIFGNITVKLAHASDNPHVDLYLRISEVDARGRKSDIVTDVYRRLDPARDQKVPVCLQLQPCAHHFSRGRRIRLLVAGGQHPKFGRNLGTGEQPNTGVAMRRAMHTLYHDAQRVSSVTLPVGVASH